MVSRMAWVSQLRCERASPNLFQTLTAKLRLAASVSRRMKATTSSWKTQREMPLNWACGKETQSESWSLTQYLQQRPFLAVSELVTKSA